MGAGILNGSGWLKVKNGCCDGMTWQLDTCDCSKDGLQKIVGLVGVGKVASIFICEEGGRARVKRAWAGTTRGIAVCDGREP